jgi:hypothetical protein
MIFRGIYYLDLLLHLLVLHVYFNHTKILMFYNVQTTNSTLVDKE